MSKTDEALMREITTMMTDQSQAADMSRVESVMDKIRVLDASKSCDQVRLASCHFMTMYHTRQAMSIGMSPDGSAMGGGPMDGMGGGGPSLDLDAVEAFKEAQRADMLLGWELLTVRGKPASQEAKTARVLKIEVAQRLEDSDKLREAFDDLMKYPLSHEETLVAFTAAPFLADWKAMKKLGVKIERMPGGMEQLHLMSLQLPIPDFTQVYSLAKDHGLFGGDDKTIKAPTDAAAATSDGGDETKEATSSSVVKAKAASPRDLAWELHNVKKIRVKFQDVDCGEWTENRDELLAEIHKQGEIEWEDVPNCSHVHVKRMGGLCQAVSFGEVPMMLNGPWFTGRIHVRGKAEMPLMPEDMDPSAFGMGGMPPPDSITILVQEEEWDLLQTEEDSSVYKGTYILKQRPELPPTQRPTKDHAPVNMTFECEVTFGEADEDGATDEKCEEEVDEPVPEAAPIDESLITEFDGLELD
jgi:hypothetical protein